MKYLLTILLLSLALPVFAGLDFTGTDPTKGITTSEQIPQLDYATFIFHINPDTITGDTFEVISFNAVGVLAESQNIYVNNSKLNFRTEGISIFGSASDGIWSVPISANTDQFVCARWRIGGSGTIPDVWINGVDQTVSLISSPSSVDGHVTSFMQVGTRGGFVYSTGFNAFDGEINAVAIHTSDIGDQACKFITMDRTKTVIQDIEADSLAYYWRLDEQPLGAKTATTTYQNSATSSRITLGFFDQLSAVGETFLSK